MEDRKTAKSINCTLYIIASIFTIGCGYWLERIPRLILAGIFMYFMITIFLLEQVTKDQDASLEAHGRISASFFLVLAILMGVVTRDAKILLLFLSLPEIMLLFYIKSRLFNFLRREMIIFFVVVWVLQVVTNSKDFRDMELIMAIAIHLVLQVIIQNFVQMVEFQLRKNKEQELSLDDMLKVIMVKKDEANQAVKTKSEFLSNMSHEIRTPINAILGMNEMIAKESQEDKILEYSDNIQNAGKLLLSIINDILDYSKVESGRMELVLVEYQVSSLINDVINLFRKRIDEKALAFQVEVNKEIPNVLYGDEVRIRQIIANLMSNAVKYTDVGTVSFEVDFEERNDENLVLCIKVKDSGRGIKQEDIASLYDTFKRVDQENNRNIEGTGLGLAITKRFVDMMGGSIDVESEYNVGSTFTVRIPQDIRKSAPMGDFKSQFQKSNHVSGEAKKHYIAPDAKVLVVDDNDMNLAVVEGLLKETKIQITSVKSGKACIEYVRNNHYDVILLDHMMPGLNGVDTLKKIQEENLAPDTPVIALTANAVSGAREMYFDYGFHDYLAKPISGDKLEKAMLHWLPEDKVHPVTKEEKAVLKSFKNVPEVKESQMVGAKSPLETVLDIETAMTYSANGMEGVMANLHLYLENVENTRGNLSVTYREEAYKEYGIYAHALKSNSTTVGAIALAELAKAMELAGESEDGNYIKVHHEQMMQLYDSVVQTIASALEQYESEHAIDVTVEDAVYTEETVKEDEENGGIRSVDISAESGIDASVQSAASAEQRLYTLPEEVNDLLDRLETAADEFDSVVLDELIDSLMKMHFAKEEMLRLRRKAKEANENCEYLELKDIVLEMKKQ